MSDLSLLILGYVLLVLGYAMIGYYYGYRQAEIDSAESRNQRLEAWSVSHDEGTL